MKQYKVRYRGSSLERIINADSIKAAKREFHKLQQAAGLAPIVYVESYIQATAG